jgi:hypothetical protein
MDPYKDKVLRKSYYSKITKKPKHKQVKVSKFASEEEAKAFLDKWKEEALKKERDILEATQEVETPDDLLEEAIDKIEIPEKPVVINTKIEPMPREIIKSQLPEIKYTKFNINPPDFKKSGGGKSIILIAQSQSGKTTLSKYILRRYLNKPKESIVTYMSPSISADIYKSVRKDKNIITQDFFNPKMIKDCVKINKKSGRKTPYNFVFVLDDIIGNDVKNSTELLKMFLTYRNVNITTLLNVQDCKMVARSARHNGNNFYFLRQGSPDAIADCLNLFIGAYPPFSGLTMDQKIELYMKATQDNGIIYLDALTNKLSFHLAVPEE